MPITALLPDFAQLLLGAPDESAFANALSSAVHALGFQFFAVAHHDLRDREATSGLEIHNYPDGWRASYAARQLGRSDPIRRASHVWACGFRWRDARDIVSFSSADDAILADAHAFGIDEGFTMGVHVPGEARGSVSFATRVGMAFPERALLQAHGLGSAAFQVARMIFKKRPIVRREILTDRQLECVLWVGRGKSNWEIAQILGVTQETVKKHLQDACARYQLHNRTSLPLRALYEGSICFSDLFP
jgi:LuxR family quorum-sensing system transcriptional regulator CciR